MDYFELYGLSLSFNPDPAVIKQKFYELSKKFHPDFYIMESQEKQEEVLELSTLNNKAYQILSDPQKRLHYILELKGLLKEGENYVLPQHFLMEMMDVNEALMELEFEPDAGKLLTIKAEVDLIEKKLFDELLVLTSGFETQDDEQQKQSLLKIKDLYYRNKYLLRLRERLDK
ncbi:iron-sulfur cluster co-chaperone HscB C-terminal domain-containing protein [Pedobacter sp.]|jgi:molecular chaperone HscB|uniref:iron-sulfur cluster co-chaperone HscB C-terminal domain-containing protein n=1 Tax=Pedobacter sp. TaxID=1411316 RepID=UPI002D190941|nr:iron-sulfur cluster co-chaperone HscB C-terminal domain-containing protein [Pedobacter sp.]HWW42308.1 iron-sulfur cluster co-chaperone HscB C-terminal domain-containing protein [Pedobacter sp.]